LSALKTALDETPPPPLKEVSLRLGSGASTTTLHKKFPEESQAIVERYCAHNKRRLDNDSLEDLLLSALDKTPPPSLLEVARQAGVAAPTLHSKFPKLSRAVASRFAAYRRERDARNREGVRAEVKAICEELLRDGTYPHSAVIRSRLSFPCQSGVYLKIRREVLTELGYCLPA
jgi:hypothetical protein